MRGCAFCVCSRNYIDMGLAVYLSTLYLVRICAEIPLHSVGNAWIMIGRCRYFEWLLIAIYRPNFRRSGLLFMCRLLYFFIFLFFRYDFQCRGQMPGTQVLHVILCKNVCIGGQFDQKSAV